MIITRGNAASLCRRAEAGHVPDSVEKNNSLMTNKLQLCHTDCMDGRIELKSYWDILF